MERDFKIGLAAGLLFIAGLAFWLSTRPELSTETRALRSISDAPPVAAPSQNQPRTPDVQPPNPPKTNTGQPYRFHVVQRGDTLSGISVKYYGSSRAWQKILNANTDTIRDPNRLTPGSKLIIPE